MDWTFWWNWIPESPKQCDEIDRLDVVGRNKTWKVQTDAPERADWTLEAETGLEKSKPTHQSRKIGHNKQEHASQSPKQRQLHTPPPKKSIIRNYENNNKGAIMTENNNRAVITGLGMICAIGNSVDEAWNNAINSVSGIHKTTTLDTTDCYADLAAEVKCDTLGDFEGSEDADRSAQLCIKAAGEAMKDAGLDDFAGDPKASVIIGSCVGGAVSISDYYEHGKKASDVTKMPISSIAPQVAGQCHAGGVVTNIANACAAGTISIAYACELIRAGKADVVLAGGSDTFAAVPYAGFLSLHALDADGCSPFNRCTGITLGEGSGVVVVESYEHAKARNAKMY